LQQEVKAPSLPALRGDHESDDENLASDDFREAAQRAQAFIDGISSDSTSTRADNAAWRAAVLRCAMPTQRAALQQLLRDAHEVKEEATISNHKGDGPYHCDPESLVSWLKDVRTKDLTVRQVRVDLAKQFAKCETKDGRYEVSEERYERTVLFLLQTRNAQSEDSRMRFNDALLACNRAVGDMKTEVEKLLAEVRAVQA
jgi:hypothetical protein